MFENRRKSLIQHCERSELRLPWTKNIKNAKMVKFGDFGYFGDLGDFFENLTFAVKQRYQTSHFSYTKKIINVF